MAIMQQHCKFLAGATRYLYGIGRGLSSPRAVEGPRREGGEETPRRPLNYYLFLASHKRLNYTVATSPGPEGPAAMRLARFSLRLPSAIYTNLYTYMYIRTYYTFSVSSLSRLLLLSVWVLSFTRARILFGFAATEAPRPQTTLFESLTLVSIFRGVTKCIL